MSYANVAQGNTGQLGMQLCAIEREMQPAMRWCEADLGKPTCVSTAHISKELLCVCIEQAQFYPSPALLSTDIVRAATGWQIANAANFISLRRAGSSSLFQSTPRFSSVVNAETAESDTPQRGSRQK